MSNKVNIDEELAKMIFEEEKKKVPKKAQKTPEAYEEFCKQQNKEIKVISKTKHIPWWKSLFSFTKVKPIVKSIRINDLNESLL
tara:strand:- start:306 stop:557 length:252 start_codon:yes stop_codon:yes gene_type:complete